MVPGTGDKAIWILDFGARILTKERWESGLIHQFAKLAYPKGYRGFESPPLRMKLFDVGCWVKDCSLKYFSNLKFEV